MKIFQLEIPPLFYKNFLEEIQDFLLQECDKTEKKGKVIFTPNPEICLKTLEDSEFLQLLQKADFLTSDGIGLYIAYQINDLPNGESWSESWLWGKIVWGLRRILGVSLLPYFFFNILFRKKMLYRAYGERICGSDLTSNLVDFARKHQIPVAIVDPYFPQDLGKCASQKTFREKIWEKFPDLLFDYYILTPDAQKDIFEKIQNSQAKICFSTLGMKRQELFSLEVIQKCPNICLALGVGSSFDYYTGFQKRAPKIYRKIGFEWLYRIFTSPNKWKRLGRIYQAVIIFPIRVLLYK